MSSLKIGRSHRARKALFTRGIRRGYLVLEEIDEALPSGSLTDAERWLLFYSLRAARVEVRDRTGNRVDLRAHAGERPRGLSQVGPDADAGSDPDSDSDSEESRRAGAADDAEEAEEAEEVDEEEAGDDPADPELGELGEESR